MRIVGGRFRGANLAAPKSQAIRPTSDRLRERIFDILAHNHREALEETRVLDLFSGTGALGLEALSRGARFCLFVEEAAEAETVRELAGLWQALSPRECQVAQLAAEGLTTKAVSDVLGIAERTAQVHVAHVCSKLGVENAVGVAQIIARLRARGVLQ